MNKAFKTIKSELESGEDDNEEILKLIAFHFRTVTDQLLNDNQPR
jgi:hypothetical protein